MIRKPLPDIPWTKTDTKVAFGAILFLINYAIWIHVYLLIVNTFF